MKTENIKIEGMSCMHCIKAVKDELSNLPLEVKKVEIGSAEIVYDENKVNKDDIKKAVEDAGYKIRRINK